MFDWIPLSSYEAIYYNVMLLLMLIIIYHSSQNELFNSSTSSFSEGSGFFLLLFMAFYLGTRPISYIFGDMVIYGKFYDRVLAGEVPTITKDFIFNYFLLACTKIMDSRMFFFLCTVIYITPCYVFAKKYCGTFWFFALFIFFGSFMFWPYGTNGIRNGLGTSVFILALCFYDKKIIMFILFALSYGIHSSLVIPIAGFLAAGIYKNPKMYGYIWLAAIPLSLIGGSFWEGFFGGLGFGDDTRAADYLTKGNFTKENFAYTGFRWDFLIYSSFAAFAGWYFIFKKNITDKFYIHLWGTYMIANAFWILIIRANFSNRFAYLSWFLMAPVIAYPLLRYKLFPNQYRVVGIVLAVYYLFTYFMFLKK